MSALLRECRPREGWVCGGHPGPGDSRARRRTYTGAVQAGRAGRAGGCERSGRGALLRREVLDTLIADQRVALAAQQGRLGDARSGPELNSGRDGKLGDREGEPALDVRPNGEVIALLVIAPSKTHRERVIPMLAALFHVIAVIIRRLAGEGRSVPLATQYNREDRTTSVPQPFLFQRRLGERDQVITQGAMRAMLYRLKEELALTLG